MIHLQRFKKNGPKPTLHHSEGTLADRTRPGMVVIEALGFHTFSRLPVWSDEGQWMLETRVAAVCQQEVSWRRVGSLLVQRAVPQESGVMHRPRPAHVNVYKVAPVVTHRLHLHGGKQLFANIAVIIGAARQLDPHVAAVDHAGSLGKGRVSGQACKALAHCCQVSCTFWKVDDLVADGHHLLGNSVNNTVDGGTRHPENLGHVPVGRATSQPEEEDQGFKSGPPSMSAILVEQLQQHCQRVSVEPKVAPGVVATYKPL